MDSYSNETQGRQMNVRVLLVAEMTVRASAPLADLNAKLDAFREAVLPSDCGITLYQATAEDLMAFIGPLWMPVRREAKACVRCQLETEESGECAYCPECCAAWGTHENCDCFVEKRHRS
jgi:hypothetical protein